MRIGFFASGISPHISEICDELYQRYGEEFRFFGTDKEPIPAMYIMGAGNLHKEKAYFYNVNDQEDIMEMSKEWAENAEVAIVGCSNCYHYIDMRLAKGNKLTFKLRERLFKNGNIEERDEKLNYKIEHQFLKYKDQDLFFLCAGTFAPYDFVSIGVDEKKLIRWGYFPKVSEFSYEEIKRDYTGKIELIWVGRFVREKLVFHTVDVVEQLLQSGYKIRLKLIGYGALENELKEYVKQKHLQNHILFLGAKNETEIRKELRKAHIFLMTSNYEEGWGAVVNEAMSEGCIPVASYATGAAATLMEDGDSGKLYFYEEIDDMKKQIESLLIEPGAMKRMSKNAYLQISELWNAKVAVKRLLEFVNAYEKGEEPKVYYSGPCAKIQIVRNEKEVMEMRSRRE